jgi:rubredoxin
MEAMRRKLVWVERPDFLGWGCSECGWVFNPTGPPTGESLAEMKTHFEQLRDKQFKSHVCGEHPTTRAKA